MSNKQLITGIDRFLALDWANYSLELFLSSEDESRNYQLLKTYLQNMISGKDSSRKTSNQLKRLWLNSQDEHQGLRLLAADILNRQQFIDQSIFHLGMSVNVFPIFKETCKKIGELHKVQETLNSQTVIDRVAQTFINPSSIPRIVSRVMQTLVDWKFLEVNHREIKVRGMTIEDAETCCWFIQAMMSSNSQTEIPLSDMDLISEKLGVMIPDIRNHVQHSKKLAIRRGLTGDEIIVIRNLQ